MKTLIKALTASAIGALMIGSASAADVYGRGSLKDGDADFSNPGLVNWTGFYIGGQAGYGKAQHDLSVEVDGIGEVLGFDGIGGDGFIGGGRLGYDFARGRFLFGVFGEYNFTNLETELSAPGITYTLEKDDEWSVGARAGVIVAPRTLLYILAAYTQSDYSLNGPGIVASPGFDPEKTLHGITGGVGFEYAVTGNAFIGLEGTYTAYDTETWLEGGGARLNADTDELKVMGTLKIKLNGFGN